jgi:hypothetical protein
MLKVQLGLFTGALCIDTRWELQSPTAVLSMVMKIISCPCGESNAGALK